MSRPSFYKPKINNQPPLSVYALLALPLLELFVRLLPKASSQQQIANVEKSYFVEIFAILIIFSIFHFTPLQAQDRTATLSVGKRISISLTLQALLGAVACVAFSASIYHILVEIIGLKFLSVKDFLAINTKDWSIIFPAIFDVVILAPLIEEYMFRGWMFQKFKEVGKSQLFPIYSIIFFGIAHVGQAPIKLFTTMLLAAICCWLFLRTRGLLMPILAHATNNALAVSLALWGY